MTDGPIDGNEITCPWHGARFDVATGQALYMRATEPVVTYEVEVRDGNVFVAPIFSV